MGLVAVSSPSTNSLGGRGEFRGIACLRSPLSTRSGCAPEAFAVGEAFDVRGQTILASSRPNSLHLKSYKMELRRENF
jgi:hypothetical protein